MICKSFIQQTNGIPQCVCSVRERPKVTQWLSRYLNQSFPNSSMTIKISYILFLLLKSSLWVSKKLLSFKTWNLPPQLLIHILLLPLFWLTAESCYPNFVHSRSAKWQVHSSKFAVLSSAYHQATGKISTNHSAARGMGRVCLLPVPLHLLYIPFWIKF